MSATAARRLAGLSCAAILTWSALSAGVDGSTPAAALEGASQVPARTSKAPRNAPAASTVELNRLIEAGAAAREAQRWEEAIQLYGKAVKLKPDYVEGHWYLGTAYYSLDNFAKGAETFRKVVRLAPNNGAAYAFLGLCEFGLKDYDRSLQHLLQSRTLGVGDTGELGNVARYHASVLMTRMEQFEQALETLGEFASAGNDNPRIIEAMGLATLRMAMLPTEAPPDRREMVLMAGRASYMMATRNAASAAKAFEALVARYPETPNVHYAYGVYLLQEHPDKAVEEFTRELELQPSHPSATMQIAFEYLKRGDGQAALPWARKAVAEAPNAFPAHKALGQALLETGDIEGAIRQLEIGITLAPDSPGLHFILARAYQRAGRAADAARAREEFTRLDRLARTQRSGAQSVGGR